MPSKRPLCGDNSELAMINVVMVSLYRVCVYTLNVSPSKSKVCDG